MSTFGSGTFGSGTFGNALNAPTDDEAREVALRRFWQRRYRTKERPGRVLLYTAAGLKGSHAGKYGLDYGAEAAGPAGGYFATSDPEIQTQLAGAIGVSQV